MRKLDVQNAVNALGRVAVNKIKDDVVRNVLIHDYLRLRKASREIEQERLDLVEKFQADFRDELQEIQQLRVQGLPVTGHDEFLAAEAETNRLVKELFREEVTIDLKKVPLEDFVKSVKDGEYTLEDLSALDGIILE